MKQFSNLLQSAYGIITRGGNLTMKKLLAIFIFLALFVASCAPSPELIASAIEGTLTALPSATPYPTYTLIPTATKTQTPSLTPTTTNTPTPKITKTNTPEPQTKTAQAIVSQKTSQAKNVTSTAQALVRARTATAQSKAQEATRIAQYKTIDYRELQSYAGQHKGEKVYVRGRVFNIAGSNDMQLYFAGTYEAFYVTTSRSFSGIYENNVLTIYGTVAGEKCFKNIYDAEICQPYLKDAFFVK